jgi:hypothetical protein
VSATLKFALTAAQGATGNAAAGTSTATTDAEARVDGCDVEITSVTADEDLPVAKGGVA